jgi:hypothetical protein
MPQQLGYITLQAPQPQTNAGQDTVLTFSQQCDQVTVQNNTNNIAWVSFDGATANGAKLLQPGMMIIESKFVSSVYLNTPIAVNINGTTLPNIAVLGEA